MLYVTWKKISCAISLISYDSLKTKSLPQIMLLYGAFLSRPVLVVQPCFKVYSHIHKNIKYLLCLPPFCIAISQETLPIVPSGFALTTTKNYGSTGQIIYDIWREVDVWENSAGSGTNWGDNTVGIWNALCKAGRSNFWTQRAFCSSANKYLWAAFSDTA